MTAPATPKKSTPATTDPVFAVAAVAPAAAAAAVFVRCFENYVPQSSPSKDNFRARSGPASDNNSKARVKEASACKTNGVGGIIRLLDVNDE